MAAKDNARASDIDKTSFWWTGMCGACHPGGGPSEFDRDGRKYFDVATGKFGYESLGKAAADVLLDGDYAEVSNVNGALRAAPWDKTGVAEADCLFCHRADRTVTSGKNMNWIWRAASLRGKDALVDSGGGPVPGYAAAATAAQGWFSAIALNPSVPAGQPPQATSLDISYQPGVDAGTLLVEPDQTLRLAPTAISAVPTDYACWGCHITPEVRKRGRVWFDATKDVHYAGFNRLRDADPSNDVPATASTACTRCHPSGADHNIAKGNTTLGTARDDTDFAGFRTCRDCHLRDSPLRDPEAPVVDTRPGGEERLRAHQVVRHLDLLSCDVCHIPFKTDPADMVIDMATTGQTPILSTQKFLSADPLDPTATDKTRWYPSFTWKKDQDGVLRLFPMKVLLTAWWGEWDRNGTPADRSDDRIAPIPLWRVRGVTAGAPLAGAADDTGDGTKEVNTPAEIALYIAALRGNDRYGVPVALNPVLVKGGKVYHDDGAGGVAHFEVEGSGIKTESAHPFAADHNVLPASEALGSFAGAAGCAECHKTMNGNQPTRVFDRKILVDPWGEDGKPIYKTVRELVLLPRGLDPW